MNFSTRQLYKAKMFDRKRKFFCYCVWVCRWKPAARMHTRVSRTRYLRDTALFLSCTSKGSTRQATKLTRPRNSDRSLPALPRPLRSSLKGGTKNAIWSRLCACLGICPICSVLTVLSLCHDACKALLYAPESRAYSAAATSLKQRSSETTRRLRNISSSVLNRHGGRKIDH